MEPYTHYLMWMKSRNDIVMSSLLNMKNNHPSSSSWEEEVFANDKAGGGVLGGFVWPQRSYFCSFCKREFMSAQALGGHMNVHRRDRAKLKQSLINSPPTTSQAHHHQDQNHTSTRTSSPPKLQSPWWPKNEEPMKLNQQHDCSGDRELSFGINLEEDIIRGKRPKKTSVSLLHKPFSIIDKYGLQSERFGLHKANSITEDIDLELRLGDPPAVK